MPVLVHAAVGLPTILFSAALAVVVCFWLLVAVGVMALDAFDEDADLDAWGMGGVPVSVAVSVLTVLAWLLGVGATVLLVRLADDGAVTGLLRPVVSAGALLVALRLTCLFVRLLHRLFPDEPGSALSPAHNHRAA
ncbi:hypothetical protein [Streptomyces sp. MB09-02B]|uniref:hypothetical protein n=1 Tax=Streptomyces sp. MB09-02B TaxID=3028667 RepID=UPI0029B44B30|nr:hypothetical protein [Streptomyces sp. MB09-02B]MDX3639835.1 hypothetical protein [Streptomyces sp. MB09-02B]